MSSTRRVVMLRLTIIVAATKSYGIGLNGTLPWRLPREMKHFAHATTNASEGMVNVVIMGRNTWESIPSKYRPLARRMNIILSRNERYPIELSQNAHLRTTLASALEQLQSSDDEAKPLYRAFIIGGAALYSEALALPISSPAFVDRILLTRIISPDFENCDTFMPDFIKDKDSAPSWERASHVEFEDWVGSVVPEGIQEENGVQYEFQMWRRNL